MAVYKPPDGGPEVQEGVRRRLPGGPGGSDVAYARGVDLVVEWYDFGDDDHYEMVNLIIFDPAAQLTLAIAMDAPTPLTPDELAIAVAARFTSYFEVKAFADEHGIPMSATWSGWP